MNPDSYAAAFVLIDCALAFVFYGAAGIIVWKGRREQIAWLAALALVTYGTTFPILVYMVSKGHLLLEQWTHAVDTIGWLSLFLFFLLFPNGRFSPSWTSFIYIPFMILELAGLIFRHSWIDLQMWSGSARILVYAAAILTMIVSQVYRYRRLSTSTERQQTKWVVFGVSISFAGFIGVSAFFVYPAFAVVPMTYILLNTALHLFVAIIPVSLTFSVLRKRLWDIDPLVNRTLVYGALSLLIILLYAGTVLYLSRLFRSEGNFLISLTAASLVAVAFVPLKARLQKMVNRWLNGRHDDPYAVLVELSNHLTKPIDPERTLDVVAATVRDALRLPYASVALRLDGQNALMAVSEKNKYELYEFPVIHGGEEQGTLMLSSRSAGEGFTAEDRKLIDVLLRQVGPILQNVRMTIGMKLLAKDLQVSREKLVLAREEERLQIRRNLHDDLAPRLMSLAFNVAAAEQYIRKSPDTAIDLLGELRKTIRTTVDDIRTMVHDLRPPTLDEFGLLGSIQARMDELFQASGQTAAAMQEVPAQVSLLAPRELPALPAAVEVAAYRIVTESLVNVAKHAKATQCAVHISIEAAHALLIEVTDNGVGLPAFIRPSGSGGIGLTSIRDRAAELGGSCMFERLESGGTRVKATLPFEKKGETT
ncbi:sensor histidine kinase [Paenibacillus aestuarii]|uniref:histidine kinase n=1 Tax=Paenibacillus aestuarii TaxID=516965 RepID=A0ABW0KB95_9BACL|nr:sensor histidine kinase [Paenibacillus aestuarii]